MTHPNKEEHKIKDNKLNPLPKTIRKFKYQWLKEQYQSYSDEQIRWLIKTLLEQDK